jgi:hypothetical protein
MRGRGLVDAEEYGAATARVCGGGGQLWGLQWSIGPNGILRQPEIVVGTWRAARAEQDDITEAEAREALTQLDPLWDELFPAEQARIVQLLVERVDMRMHGIEVRLRANGLAGLMQEVAASRRAAA